MGACNSFVKDYADNLSRNRDVGGKALQETSADVAVNDHRTSILLEADSKLGAGLVDGKLSREPAA